MVVSVPIICKSPSVCCTPRDLYRYRPKTQDGEEPSHFAAAAAADRPQMPPKATTDRACANSVVLLCICWPAPRICSSTMMHAISVTASFSDCLCMHRLYRRAQAGEDSEKRKGHSWCVLLIICAALLMITAMMTPLCLLRDNDEYTIYLLSVPSPTTPVPTLKYSTSMHAITVTRSFSNCRSLYGMCRRAQA